jgi:hypothetical protein
METRRQIAKVSTIERILACQAPSYLSRFDHPLQNGDSFVLCLRVYVSTRLHVSTSLCILAERESVTHFCLLLCLYASTPLHFAKWSKTSPKPCPYENITKSAQTDERTVIQHRAAQCHNFLLPTQSVSTDKR